MRKRTRTLTVAIAAALMAAIALPALCSAETAAGPEANEREMAIARNLIDRLVERYESERSYRIAFAQESYWALADTSMHSNGVLLLERPTKLSVRYDDGSNIVSNGDTLWVYMSQTNQYFSTDIGADDTVIDPPRVLRQYAPDPSGPYAGSDALADSDGALRSPVSAVTEATLFLIPADGAGEPARLEVTIDPSRNLVTGMAAQTRSGDFTRYEISETRFGVETSPDDFTFEAPPGAERIGG